jgi:DNA-binding LytR/AlgR family response regulator
MKVVIVEDEAPALDRLAKLLLASACDVEIITTLDSVESAVKYFSNVTAVVDVIFMDIQLGDGLSFDIFKTVKITTPIIFTTAFDQYTLQAFKVNSIDYLLKPIDNNELQLAIKKYQQLHKKAVLSYDADKIIKLIAQIGTAKYKERLLIKRGQQFSYLKTDITAYCFADGKLCYAVDINNNKFLLETNLTELETQLAPNHFFRINRSLVIHINAIKKVHTWLGGRLKVELHFTTSVETIVSRDRVNDFKQWLGQ